MANPTTPDISYEPSQSVKAGYSKPIFIVKQGDVYYLTKVVWPYHHSLAGGNNDTLDAIKDIADAYDNSPDQNSSAREVTEDDAQHIIEGFIGR
jgi:hypothetical protein